MRLRVLLLPLVAGLAWGSQVSERDVMLQEALADQRGLFIRHIDYEAFGDRIWVMTLESNELSGDKQFRKQRSRHSVMVQYLPDSYRREFEYRDGREVELKRERYGLFPWIGAVAREVIACMDVRFDRNDSLAGRPSLVFAFQGCTDLPDPPGRRLRWPQQWVGWSEGYLWIDEGDRKLVRVSIEYLEGSMIGKDNSFSWQLTRTAEGVWIPEFTEVTQWAQGFSKDKRHQFIWRYEPWWLP